MQSTMEELSLQNVAGFETHTSRPQEITSNPFLARGMPYYLYVLEHCHNVLELEEGLGCAAETSQFYFQNSNKEESLQLQRNYHFYTPAE